MIKKNALLIAMMTLTVIMFFSAWNTGNLYILASSCVMVAFVILGCVYPLWAVRNVTLSIDKFPNNLDDETLITIHLNGSNSGWLTRHKLFLNLKTVSSPHKTTQLAPIPLPAIKTGRFFSALDIGSIPRGRYELSKEAAFYTGFPFGLIEKKKGIAVAKGDLVVYPYRFPISGALFNLSKTPNYTAIQSRQSVGHSSEFLSIREYRYGDSIKHIDWKTTAKHNKIIVREFEEITTKSFIIAINDDMNFSPALDAHNIFEKSLRIAASISTELLKLQHPVGLYTHNAQLSPNAGDNQEDKIMNLLVDAENTNNKNYWPLLYRYVSGLASPQTILLFENMVYEKSFNISKKLEMLAALNHEVKLVLFAGDNQNISLRDVQTWKIPVNENVGGFLFEQA